MDIFTIAMWLVLVIMCSFLLFTALILFIITPRRIRAKIAGSHVFITGGSKGIGKMIALEMIKKGARHICVAARNSFDLHEAREYLIPFCSKEQTVHTVELDIAAGYEVVRSTLQNVIDELGPIDILVNNAGYVMQESFSELPINAFEDQMKVNYFGAVYATRVAVEFMKLAKRGHIAFVSSAAGQCAIWGYSAYSPSKFAVRGLAETLHMELLPFNVGVSILYPPNTATEGFEVEKRNMPEEVRLISNAAGNFSAEEVAQTFVKDMMNGEFTTCIGLEGKLLGWLSAGAAPEPSVKDALIQSYFGGLFRGIMIMYLWTFNAAVKQCHNLKQSKKKEKESESESSE